MYILVFALRGCYCPGYCLRSFTLQDCFKSLSICSQGKKHETFCLNVFLYLHVLSRRAQLSLELFASSRFLSRISYYLSSYIFLLRRHSFTSRKVYISLETLLRFLQLSDRACFLSSMYRFLKTYEDK